MNGKVHATAGIIFGAASLYALHKLGAQELLVNTDFTKAVYKDISTGDLLNSGILLGSSWIGSLLPDIDHPTSTFSKKFSIISFLYRILQFIFGIFKKTKGLVGHRGITHSLLFMAIPIICMFFIDNQYVILGLIGLSVGIFSHLFMDMLNPTGVPLLLPFAKKKFRLLPKKIAIKTK